MSFEGHTSWVNNFLVYENKLISCSNDKTIKIWDLNSYQCLQTLEGHTGCVKNILVYQNKLISCSYDKTIKIWDLNCYQCLKTYFFNTHILKAHEGLLYYNDNNTIKILKYQPFYDNYYKALKTIFIFINKSKILFRGEVYRGKFFVREKRLQEEMYDKYYIFKSTDVI